MTRATRCGQATIRKADDDGQPRNANVFASRRFRGWSSSAGRDIRLSSGPIAQRLEQGTHNPLVPGSNPGGPNSNFRFGIGGFRKGNSGNRRSDCRRAGLILRGNFRSDASPAARHDRTPSQTADFQSFCVKRSLQSLSGSNFRRKR
jgi:hypothetical protein